MQCSTSAVARWTVGTTATVSCHYPPSDAVLTEPMEISRSEPLKMVQNFIFVLDQTDTGSPVNAWPEWSARKRQTGCETLAFYTMSLGVISPWITCGFSFLHLACAQWIFTWADWYRWKITFLLISSRDFMSINVIFLYLRGRLTCLRRVHKFVISWVCILAFPYGLHSFSTPYNPSKSNDVTRNHRIVSELLSHHNIIAYVNCSTQNEPPFFLKTSANDDIKRVNRERSSLIIPKSIKLVGTYKMEKNRDSNDM